MTATLRRTKSEAGESIVVSVRPSRLYLEVLIFDIASLTQRDSKGLEQNGQVTWIATGVRRRAGTQKPDPSNFPGLLRLGGDLRKREAESENDPEPDQPHGHLDGGWLAGV